MSDSFGVGIFFIVLIVLFQSIISSYFSAKKIRYFHETGIAIILGMALSAVAYFRYEFTVPLNKSVFLYVFLPAIIFSEGFSMKKRYFFKNMAYILTYGLLGTIITFTTLTLLLHVISDNEMVQIQVKGKDGEWETKQMDLSLKDLTLFSAALSSKDSFIGSTMVDHHAHPILFNVIFGEGIINDATTFILFDSFELLVEEDKSHHDLEWSIIPKILWIMLKSVSFSVSVGVFFGICCTLLLKHITFLTEVHEILIIITSSYSCYCIVESFHFSGVLSLLFCGIVIGHYAFYNLSKYVQKNANFVFHTLSRGAENFLFAYLGFSTFSFYRHTWSFTLIGYTILFLILGRFISVFVMSVILRIFFKKGTFAMGIRQQLVLQFTGISRGIIGYLLMNQVQSNEYQEVLQSSILGVLIITTLIFGLINPKLIDCVLPPSNHSNGQEHVNERMIADINRICSEIDQECSHVYDDNSEYENGNENENHSSQQILRYQITESLLNSKFDLKLFKSKWSYYIQKFNAKKIKPFLIRDYYQRIEDIIIAKDLFKEDRFELMRPDGVPKNQELTDQFLQKVEIFLRQYRLNNNGDNGNIQYQEEQNNNIINEENQDINSLDEQEMADGLRQIRNSFNLENR